MSYDSLEMQKMQDEAKQRLVEMHKRSIQVKSQMERDLEAQQDASIQNNTAKGFVALAQQPKNHKMPVDIGHNEIKKTVEENTVSEQQINSEETKRESESTPEVNLNEYGKLSQDELEKMFLLSLSLLLSYEQADEGVLLALMYLAM